MSDAPATDWVIDPNHSTFEFAIRHMMVSTIKGAFARVTGEIHFDPQNVGDSSVSAEVDIASLDTHHSGRDEKLLGEHTFEVKKYPTASFESRRAAPAEDGHVTVVGDLTFKDVTREVMFDVAHRGYQELPDGGWRTAFVATGTIKRSDYGLSPGRELPGGGVSLSDEVQLELFTTCNAKQTD